MFTRNSRRHARKTAHTGTVVLHSGLRILRIARVQRNFDTFSIDRNPFGLSREAALFVGGQTKHENLRARHVIHVFTSSSARTRRRRRFWIRIGGPYMARNRRGKFNFSSSNRTFFSFGFFQIWYKNSTKPKRFKKPVYLFWRSALCSSRPPSSMDKSWMKKTDDIRPLRSSTIIRGSSKMGEAAGCTYVFDR